MRPVKGVDLLLKAALRLEPLRDIYWLLIGEVSDPRIEALARDPRIADRVRLTGPRPGGGHLSSLFDVYASPSRMEGFGMSVVEAMAQHVCPLVSNVGGLPELVEHEVNGLVVPKEDVESIAGSIRRLHDDVALRRKLAEAAYERASSVFSIEAWAGRLTQAYEDICADKMLIPRRAG